MIDEEVDRGGGLELLENLLSDRSATGVRAIYAVGSQSWSAELDRVKRRCPLLAVLKKPFGLSAIREVLAEIPIETPSGEPEKPRKE